MSEQQPPHAAPPPEAEPGPAPEALPHPGPEEEHEAAYDQPTPERPRRRRWVLVVAVLLGLVLVATAVAVPLLLSDDPPAYVDRTLDEVQRYDDLPNDHVPGDVDYDQAPPAGGPHAVEWHACGVYDEPRRDENVVHSLEHGTVWFTYRPGLAEDELAELEEELPSEGILSPYPDQEAPVVVTVWGRQLALEGADDPRLALFLREYGDGHTSPEPFASCEGGVRAFADGGGGIQA